MKLKKKYTLAVVFALFIVVGIFIAGCGTSNNTAKTNAIALKSGAQLWGESCASCHNIRPPQTLTDAQWEVVGMHMRGRANLTAVEEQKIIKFLKSAN